MGPYGLRRVTYADYTASGRSLTNISPGGPPRDGRIGQRDNLLGSRRASALDAGLGPAGCARRGRHLPLPGAWLTPGRFAPDANNFGTPASVRPGLVVSLRVVQEIDPTRLSWRG